jgi:hypothetical protein
MSICSTISPHEFHFLAAAEASRGLSTKLNKRAKIKKRAKNDNARLKEGILKTPFKIAVYADPAALTPSNGFYAVGKRTYPAGTNISHTSGHDKTKSISCQTQF